MDVFEAIKTTRAMRRLDASRPVSDADLRAIVEAGTKGPTGSNAQPVRWMVVTDADKRRQLGEIYKACWEPVSKMYGADPSRVEGDNGRVFRSANHLGDHMGDAPAIVIPCARGDAGQLASSVFGCVQNLMLAARALGLGTALTTVHRMREQEVRDVLDIP
ncbi:MAG: nitroreductase family protein, partial [Actinobacteria bacterium]|nr:nitroreductase family protein [Actinomycetota bacterium]